MTRATTAVLLAIALVAAGCGDGQETAPAATDDPAADEPTTEDPDDDADTTEDPADDPASDGTPTVSIAETSLGEVLVDGEGRTLYLFDPDEQGPSTCVDECAANWPPLLDEEPEAGPGVEADLLATAERDDGAAQVTYDGWPLYHWIADEEPGDVDGQGVEDVWWVVRADGSALREEAESAPSY